MRFSDSCDSTVTTDASFSKPFVYPPLDIVVTNNSAVTLCKAIYGNIDRDNDDDPANLIIYEHDNFVKSLFRQHEHGNDFCREAIIHLGFPPSTNTPKEVITARLQKMLQAVPKVDNNIPDIPHMFLSSLKSLIQSSSVLNEHFSILKDIVDSLHQNKYVADLGDPWYEFLVVYEELRENNNIDVPNLKKMKTDQKNDSPRSVMC